MKEFISFFCIWLGGFLLGFAVGGFFVNRSALKQLNEMRASMDKYYQFAMNEHSKN